MSKLPEQFGPRRRHMVIDRGRWLLWVPLRLGQLIMGWLARDREAWVTVFVVGGHGYVGWRVVTLGLEVGEVPRIVSRDGDTRGGRASSAWADWIEQLADEAEASSVIWLLDGAKHDEASRLPEMLAAVSPETHVVFVSSCTVYGDAGGELCSEDHAQQLTTVNARVKASSEQLLLTSPVSVCIQRLGALYGVDRRGVRADRVEEWVMQAAGSGTVVVPEPTHWRGWTHVDQAARALWRAAHQRTAGTFNIASANHTFGEAAGYAALIFAGSVVGDGKPDRCDYRVDSAAARAAGLLDEQPGEDLAGAIQSFIRERYPDGLPPG